VKLTIAWLLLVAVEAERPEVPCGPQAAVAGAAAVASYPWWEFALRHDPDRPFAPRFVWPWPPVVPGGVWSPKVVSVLAGTAAAEAWYRSLWKVDG
jgi:hypothetical protein